MMPKHEFCDSCAGCRPALLDVESGETLDKSDPLMQTINRIWDTGSTYAQRKAFIEVTLHNSRRPKDLKLMRELMNKIELEVSGPGH